MENLTLVELQEQGVNKVILDGFTESLECVMSLGRKVKFIGFVKSYDGYSEIAAFELV